MKKSLFLVAIIALAGMSFVQAADLQIETQVNVAAPDDANNYATFIGPVGAVTKDQFVAVDAVSGASKLKGTELFNKYRLDVQNKATIPGGLRGIFLYGIAGNATRLSDGLTVLKAADGTIVIRTVHRGTAYEVSTDTSGILALPTNSIMSRKIGHTDNQISTDFSTTGKVADVAWVKVWDASIADGKVVGTTSSKTGKIAPDLANSNLFYYQGNLQVTFENNILKIKGSLDAKKK